MKRLPLLLVVLASCNEPSHLKEGGSTGTSATTTYSTASEIASSDAQPKEAESPIAETSEEALPPEIAVNPVPVAGAYLTCSPRPDQGDLSCFAESTDKENEDFHFVAKSAYVMLGDSNLWTELSFECDLEKSNSWFLKLPPESLTTSYAVILRSEESGVLATWTIDPAVETGNLVADGGFEENTIDLNNRKLTQFLNPERQTAWKVRNANPDSSCLAILELQNRETSKDVGKGQWTELDSSCEASGRAAGNNVLLYQDLDTVAGHLYQFSFIHKSRATTSPLPQGIRVRIDGTVVLDQTSTAKDWEEFQTVFLAGADAVRIEFEETGDPKDGLGTLLDEVIVRDLGNGPVLP